MIQIPQGYEDAFKEYLSIRLLNDMSEGEYQKLVKTTSNVAGSKEEVIEQLIKMFPKFKVQIHKYCSDFLDEIYGKNK